MKKKLLPLLLFCINLNALQAIDLDEARLEICHHITNLDCRSLENYLNEVQDNFRPPFIINGKPLRYTLTFHDFLNNPFLLNGESVTVLKLAKGWTNGCRLLKEHFGCVKRGKYESFFPGETSIKGDYINNPDATIADRRTPATSPQETEQSFLTRFFTDLQRVQQTLPIRNREEEDQSTNSEDFSDSEDSYDSKNFFDAPILPLEERRPEEGLYVLIDD